MSNSINGTFQNCPDCGNGYFSELAHKLVCKGAPVVIESEAERIFPSADPDTPEETEEGVKFTCVFCQTFVIQDPEAEILTIIEGGAVCSHVCQEAANAAILHERELCDKVIEACKAYAELDRIEYAHAQYYKDRKAAAARLLELVGLGFHWQDEQGTVYETSEKRGQWVDFTPYEVHRTRRDTDLNPKGSLSLDRAEELGYEVERKRAKAKTTPTAPVDPAPGKDGGENVC